MKKILYIIIPIIILLTILLIIIFIPKKEKTKDIKKITSISHFSFYYSQGYSINSDIRYYLDCDNKCIAKIKPYGMNEETIKEVDDSFVESLITILNNYEVIKWDGFDRVAKDVLDGDSFSLYLESKDSIKIHSSGYMLWPENYREVREELNKLFNSLL